VNLVRVKRLPDGLFTIATPFNKHAVELAKDIPGLKWVAGLTARVGYEDAARVYCEKLAAEGLAKVVWEAEAPFCVALSSSLALKRPLRNYQLEGVKYLIAHAKTGALLADCMGGGKTTQSLAAILELNEYPALIVCPANVRWSWVREAEALGLHPPLILTTKKPPKDGSITKDDGIVICNYDILNAWKDALKGVKTIVFDEIQLLANEKSQRSKAAKQLAHHAANRIGLSGTPMSNAPAELWNVADTISPGRFGKPFSYYMRYCDAHQVEIKKKSDVEGEEDEVLKKVWKYDGSSNKDELARRLSYFMLRRTKADIALELPPKTRQLIEIELTDYNNPDHWWSADNKNAAQVALGIAGTLKIPHTVDLAVRSRQDGNSVVIFCFQKQIAAGLQKALAKQGVESYLATGDETSNKRQENAERARDEGAVLIATIDAMGTGINYLSYANVIIFAELHYVFTRLLQAEDRAHRFGQKQNVFIYYMVALGTIDETIRDRLRIKIEHFEGAVGTTGESIRDDLMGETEEEALAAIKKMAMEMENRNR
jgi:SWI/SNF-related matrix-associated actin-dependent regulator of chromatin subfamily A-like protein 1